MQAACPKPRGVTYVCIVCDHKVMISHALEPLPTCPMCGNYAYEKKD